jgi:hypothetical protein
MSNIDEGKKDFYVDVDINMDYDMDYDMDYTLDVNKDVETKNKKFDNKELSIFLRNLADSIDNETIESNNLKIVGEFYMKYKFNNFKKDGKTYEFTEEEIVKFIFLGWFIYNIILKDSELRR